MQVSVEGEPRMALFFSRKKNATAGGGHAGTNKKKCVFFFSRIKKGEGQEKEGVTLNL